VNTRSIKSGLPASQSDKAYPKSKDLITTGGAARGSAYNTPLKQLRFTASPPLTTLFFKKKWGFRAYKNRRYIILPPPPPTPGVFTIIPPPLPPLIIVMVVEQEMPQLGRGIQVAYLSYDQQ